MTAEEKLGVPVPELAASLGLDQETTSAYLTADLSAPRSETNRKPDKVTAVRILEGIEALRQNQTYPRRVQT